MSTFDATLTTDNNNGCGTADGSTSWENTAVRIVSSDATNQKYGTGFMWASVTVPKNATITAAYIQLYTLDTRNNILGHIYGDAADNSSNFASTHTLWNRTKTTANVAWNVTGLAVGYVNSPDISSVIQEIVNRAGWSSGNNMSILALGDAVYDLTKVYRADCYSEGNPAKLHIVYTSNTHFLSLLGVGK